jgi:uncharacterized protein (DUF1501 family)
MNMNISRRNLLQTAASAAVITVAPGVKAAFGAQGDPILIVLFQRGACDWLHLLAPAGDANYIAARPTTRVTTTGSTPGIGIGSLGGVDFYLNSACAPLREFYTAGQLAFVHATGIRTTDRSHFSVQAKMEHGTADGDPVQTGGWLARHITSCLPNMPPATTSCVGPNIPASLAGDIASLAVSSTASFTISGSTSNPEVLRAMNAGSSAYKSLATETLDAIVQVKAGLASLPASVDPGYTAGPVSKSLKSVAQLIKMNIGLRVAFVDTTGWDMHNNLVSEFNTRATEFSKSLAAFWKDIAVFQSCTTLVTMTEFGRRVAENASQGTDHGTASGMLVLGGNVNGGQIYGTWPGLGAAQLTNGDLAITTDFRQVVSEILVKRQGEANLGTVFPGLTYQPLGIVRA